MLSMKKCCSPLNRSAIFDKGLDLHMKAKRARECLKWGAILIVVLAILLFDISNKCPYAFSKWYYVEYAAAAIVALSVCGYFVKYVLYVFAIEPIEGTVDQKRLLQFEDNDSSFVIKTPKKLINLNASNSNQVNATILSWNSSFNDSRSMASPNWTTPPRTSLSPGQNASWNSSMHNNSSLNASTLSSNASFMSPYMKYARDEVITDEKALKQYLREVSKQKDINQSESHTQHNSFNPTSINSFWNYCNSAANLLKTSLYQLSPSTTPMSQNKQSSKDESGRTDLDGNSEVIKRLPSEKLSHYVANLRMWMSITILQRLNNEISNIDRSFKSRGFSDIQIGSVGLERLKKTVENQQFVSQYVPALPLIVPFLDMSANQEYLVKRVKDLAKGSCIADYRWNSGSSYHGLNWDEHLPTDSSILFHIFCTYLDSQLMPLPQPGGRPFFNRYVVIGDKKTTKETLAEVTNKSGCAILCTNLQKPKFNFISDNQIHNCVYDRNNLFYVIIQFLIYMKTHNEGLLEGVNLGKSGINILCVIED